MVRVLVCSSIAFSLLATSPATGRGAPRDEAHLTGVIREIDLERRTLEIRDLASGEVRLIEVAPGAEVTLSSGRRLPLGQVEPGARIQVRDAILAPSLTIGNEVVGTIRRVDGDRLFIVGHGARGEEEIVIDEETEVLARPGTDVEVPDRLEVGTRLVAVIGSSGIAERIYIEDAPAGIFHEFLGNIRHNLFKPLLLFFYMGFLIPILRVKFEFPYVMYQALTIYLLLAIGWHGGEELSRLRIEDISGALGFMGVGFVTNLMIGVLAYFALGGLTRMRRIDRATVGGYYGSDSAGTFVTCLGVLGSAGIAYQAYMPVMLAVMEIPGCLVALYLVARLRHRGMDPAGTMPDEPGYDPKADPVPASRVADDGAPSSNVGRARFNKEQPAGRADQPTDAVREAVEEERRLALEERRRPTRYSHPPLGGLSPKLLHEVFLNPGLYLLLGGIVVGFISGLQGPEVTRADDNFFIDLFQGILCLFLLEMGMAAARKLRDLRATGPGFILFGLLAPNAFATAGIFVAHGYSFVSGIPFDLGTYVLFSVLCGSASYIAMPAVQRLAIPEASPTLPLAASLGLTFTYNVTIGIPVYIEIARLVTGAIPLG